VNLDVDGDGDVDMAAPTLTRSFGASSTFADPVHVAVHV
jgi:hypothetical protein